MDVPTLGLWLVCAMGAATFAASSSARPLALSAAVAAFCATAWWIAPAGVLDVASTSLVAAIGAGWMLVRGVSSTVAGLLAGALAAAWAGLIASQGLPFPVAVGVAAMLPMASAVLHARRVTFAPPSLRDEALLFLLIVAVTTAALPSIQYGWGMAGSLALQSDASQPETSIPGWLAVATLGAAALGGLSTIWSRR